MINKELLSILVCPVSKGKLEYDEKENVLLPKQIGRNSALLSYLFKNAENQEKSRKYPVESTDHGLGTSRLIGWLEETIQTNEESQTLTPEVSKLLSQLLSKLHKKAFSPDRIDEYFLSSWEQAILCEINHQKATLSPTV